MSGLLARSLAAPFLLNVGREGESMQLFPIPASSRPSLLTSSLSPRSMLPLSLPTRWRIRRRPTLFLRSILLLSLLVATNLLLWIASLLVSPPRGSDSFASLCLIAWTTGLRHALDADHIAAIDNATRKIIASSPRSSSSARGSRRPITVGLWFSLGHSTIVVAVTVAISISISVASRLDGVSGVGGVVGQAVSGSFLIVVAIINSVILVRAIRRRRREKKKRGSTEPSTLVDDEGAKSIKGEGEGEANETAGDEQKGLPARQGLRTIYTRLAGPLFRIVTQPYHLYPIGVLFGLGFDTASTIALLSISAAAGRRVSSAEEDLSGSEAQQEAGNWGKGGDAKVVLLALLFTAGMTLVDSVDSVLMVYAYAPPRREEGRKWWALWEERRSDEHGDTEANSPPVEKVVSSDQAEQSCAPIEMAGQERHDEEKAGSSNYPALPGHALPPPATTTLSLLLTTLSILLALIIGTIVLLSLIASRCTSCSAAAEAHDSPDEGAGGAGLAGSWWSFWLAAGDASGYIGAGVVGLFALLLIGWYGGRWVWRSTRRQERNGGESGTA